MSHARNQENSLMSQNLSTMPVQPKPCHTCPFAGNAPVNLRQNSYADYVAKVVTLESQHLCHSAHHQMLCRGGRDLLLRVLYIQGFITEPTDTAYDTARKEVLGF